MKRTLVLLSVAMLVGISTLAAGCEDKDEGSGGEATPAPAEVQLTEVDDGSTVALASDGTLIVALASNPSTGYLWAIVSPEPAFLELDGEPKFVPAGSTTAVPGAGGTQVFTLRATGAGTSTLNMAYSRTTTPQQEPEGTFTVTVETK